MRRTSWCLVVSVALVASAAVAGSDHPKQKQKEPAKPVAPPADDAAGSAQRAEGDTPAPMPKHVVGPKLVDLGHGSEIELPPGMILFEKAEAQDMMRKSGNDVSGTVAAIIPPDENASWILVIDTEDVGYVTDDDANELDANAMLEDFKAGTIEQNKQRATMGVSPLYIDGWSEPPRYDRPTHQLVWGLNAHDEGKVVNFFTRLLGRNGYLSVDLIDDAAKIETSKVQALAILKAIRFKPGAKYEDHVANDHSSGLGLKALVLGGAGVVIAKKTGLLVALLVILKKGFIVLIAAVGGFFRWITGKKKHPEVMSDVPPTDPPVG